MAAIFVRTLLLFAMLTLTFRLMGKREVGQLETSELITTLLISEIAAMPIADPDIPILFSVIPILLICSAEVIITFLKTKCNKIKKVFESTPVVIVSEGRVLKNELNRMRLTMDELLSECRQQGVWHIEDVFYAILEQNGKLSILPNSAKLPLTPEDLEIKTDERGMQNPLIIDGFIVDEKQRPTNFDEDKIKSICQRHHTTTDRVFYLGTNNLGYITLIRKEEDI